MKVCNNLFNDARLGSGPRARLRKMDSSFSGALAARCRTTNNTSCMAVDAMFLSFFFVARVTHHDKPTSSKTKPFLDPFLRPSQSARSTGTFFNGGHSFRPTRHVGNIEVYQALQLVPYVSTSSICGNDAMSPEDLAHLVTGPGCNLLSSSPRR